MYYCKACGLAYEADEAVMCVKCGTDKGKGSAFCHNCGTALDSGAAFCSGCGSKLTIELERSPIPVSELGFCRVCGSVFASNQAVICIKCGSRKGDGKKFCNHCGGPTQENQTVCLKCGRSLTSSLQSGEKSKTIAALLGIFLGWLGVHNFYLEYTQKAIIQAALGVVGILFININFFYGLPFQLLILAAIIWGIIDGIYILMDKITVDGKGNPLKRD